MNNILFLLFLNLMLITLSCRSKSVVDKKLETKQIDSLKSSTNNLLLIDKKILLEGTWAENKEDNALFYIDKDYLYYTEGEGKPISYTFKNDTLFIMGEPPDKCKILKLTNDSLWFTDEFNDKIIKLYRR